MVCNKGFILLFILYIYNFPEELAILHLLLVPNYVLCFIDIAIGVLSGAYFQTAMWNLAASNLGFKIRNAVFRGIMKQDIGWFDTHPSNKLNTRLAE